MVAGLGARAGENNAVFIEGDDAEAKALVAGLVAGIGGVAIDTGNLRTGGYLQGMSGPLAGSLEMLTPAEARERLARVATEKPGNRIRDVPPRNGAAVERK
jgi:predicted dinucleotide-binding enzyme